MLYRVAQSYVATEAMELAVERGNIVGVIKKHNPLGDTRIWFVDDGCKLYLILYTGNILCVCGGIYEPRGLVSFRLVSNYQLNAQFLYSMTIYMVTL